MNYLPYHVLYTAKYRYPAAYIIAMIVMPNTLPASMKEQPHKGLIRSQDIGPFFYLTCDI